MAKREPLYEARIRAMHSEDLDAVMAIEHASFPSPWSATTLSNLLARENACLLAAVDGTDRVLGYAAVWFAGGNGELGSLAVAPSERREGLGGLLLTAVLDEARARGITHLFLEVRQSNWTAQRLYQRRGFEAVGRRRNYYKKPVEDAIVMRRLLAR
ncbi:MAG: ribosomal protein S18-alanine N-acetyltransferase [Gemmatimonadetes bacterium]|nr:ribosomal protein S18-alanine N-acetyltransferase [Gemmatimonadota bacterium]